MMSRPNDLFSPASRPAPRPEAPRRIAFTARRVATGGGEGIDHPCGLCGAKVAPFGLGVSIRAAYATGDARRAGKWLCGPCWREGEA